MALKVISNKSAEAKPKKKLKVVATEEPEVDPEESEVDPEESEVDPEESEVDPEEPEVDPEEPEEEDVSVKKPKSKAKKSKAKESKAKESKAKESKAEGSESPFTAVAAGLRERSKKSDKLSPVKAAEVMDSASLIEAARVAYKAFQTSWYDFAKTLKELRDCEAWVARGFDDMTALCREEFPAIPPTTISKFIKVVDEFGPAIEARLKATKALPAYEALYVVAANEKNIPKEDAARLRKAAVDGKISVHQVREVVKGFVNKKPTKHAEGRSEKRKQREEETGIKKVDIDDAVETEEDVEVDESEEITSSIDKDADMILKLVRQLQARLPAVTESMKEGTNKLIELAEAIEEIQVSQNEFLDRLEAVSNP